MRMAETMSTMPSTAFQAHGDHTHRTAWSGGATIGDP
jgi:hypothetical protein